MDAAAQAAPLRESAASARTAISTPCDERHIHSILLGTLITWSTHQGTREDCSAEAWMRLLKQRLLGRADLSRTATLEHCHQHAV